MSGYAKSRYAKTVSVESSDSTVRKAIQQQVVERAERDKALKMLRSFTAANPNSRRLDLFLAFGQSLARTSE